MQVDPVKRVKLNQSFDKAPPLRGGDQKKIGRPDRFDYHKIGKLRAAAPAHLAPVSIAAGLAGELIVLSVMDSLETLQRIQLRRIEREDIPLLWKWNRNEELAMFNAFTANKSQARFYVEYEKQFESDALLDYLVLEGEEEKPVGFCGLKAINWVDRNAELFIAICDGEARRKGFGILAVLLVAKIAFFENDLHKIYAKVAANNERVLRLVKDWGFTLEGTLREMHYYNNRHHDLYVYGVLKSETKNLIGNAVEKITKHLFPGNAPQQAADQVIRYIQATFGLESNPEIVGPALTVHAGGR